MKRKFRKIIFYVISRQKLLIFFFLLPYDLLIPCGRLLIPFFYEIRDCFFFCVARVEMFFSFSKI